MIKHSPDVIPAKAGISRKLLWIPAFAGMTVLLLTSCGIKGSLERPSDIKKEKENEHKSYGPF